MGRQSKILRPFLAAFQAKYLKRQMIHEMHHVKRKLEFHGLNEFLILLLLGLPSLASADQATEYRIKTAFLYNFAVYTEWPNRLEGDFSLCFYGNHPFESYFDHISQKLVHGHAITIRRPKHLGDLHSCQIVFVGREAISDVGNIAETLYGKPVLIVSDTPDGILPGVALNMDLTEEGKIGFEVNLAGAKKSGLNFSSQLLRIAKKVHN
jgi:hypothetical protein